MVDGGRQRGRADEGVAPGAAVDVAGKRRVSLVCSLILKVEKKK